MMILITMDTHCKKLWVLSFIQQYA
jgi:hypothetical protein